MTYQKKRNTAETQLNITLANDASESNINTGVGFLDHMLTLFSFHSQLSLQIEANGDTEVDDHHVTEDIGIVLGSITVRNG
ncbi:imidazoleglycerol-phosphate dehydratase [Staphylococcus gallinarum]|uniref:Imidazoleglycerol-phosphate dehydratase n=1 Tax=Staphylococcus gallinarum TaxID=1293 RepID=A0A380FNW4_STAGA|nr:imidazoleglycerol-phosphate dehydratase [Staphylococcus gallinarum]